VKAAKVEKLPTFRFSTWFTGLKPVQLDHWHPEESLAELMEMYRRANQAEAEYQEWLAWLMRQVGQDQGHSNQPDETAAS
jgi:hypothetical protein